MDSKKVKGYISVSEIDKNRFYNSPEYFELQQKANQSLFNQAFRGQVQDKEPIISKKIGAEHSFDMDQVERVVNNIGLVNAGVEKIKDAIIGDFTVQVDDENGQALVDAFVEDSNFLSVMDEWIKEAVMKGNGYIDLTDVINNQMQVLNANRMYVKRNKQGKILKYNQITGDKNRTITFENNVNPFEPDEVAHLKINSVAGQPYGIGYVWPNIRVINHYASSELDNHKLMSRKAGAPIHVKVGIPGESVQSGDVDAVKIALQYMNNQTNWVTDGSVEMNVIDFKDVGKNLIELSNHDIEQMSMGMNIPLVMMGIANVPEGLAKVQGEGFQRFIGSIRVNVEDVIETQIFKPLLERNGLSFKINFVWSMPGEEEKNNRLTTIQVAMGSPMTSPELRSALEKEYAKILGLDDVIDMLPDPKEARQRADEEMRKREEEIRQPEVPGAKPNARSSEEELLTEEKLDEFIKKVGGEFCVFSHQTGKNFGCYKTKEEAEKRLAQISRFKDMSEEPVTMNYEPLTEDQIANMSIKDYVMANEIKELAGFNYTDYLIKILQSLKIDKFIDLRALTEKDLDFGLLPDRDINKLRVILKEGFKKNKTIREIEKSIEQSIDLKDRKKEENGELIITAKAEKRPNMIARTETIRLSNEGLKRLYLENDVKKYRYLATLDDRTSQICQELNGQVFNVDDGQYGVNMPPMHTNCRSTIIGLV